MSPSAELSRILTSLRLADAADLRRCQPLVRRFARGLMAYDSVWIDALVRRGWLTPYQARFLETGEARQLVVRGTILLQTACHLDTLAPVFLARDQETAAEYFVTRLEGLVEDLESGSQRCQAVIAALAKHPGSPKSRPLELVREKQRISLLSHSCTGEPLNRLLLRRGRFPEAVVRAIACDLAAQLAAAEGLPPHGDLRLSNVWLNQDGELQLLNWGVLAAFVPEVTIHSRLPWDSYEGLAPERCEQGKPLSPSGDLYALGCLLWQLLTGRPPYPTNDPLEKMAAHRTRQIADVRSLAPETSPELALLLRAMTAREPHRRPVSPLEISRQLHGNRRRDRQTLARFVRSFESAAPRKLTEAPQRPRHQTSSVAAAVLLTLIAVGLAWNRDRIGLPSLDRAAAATRREKPETTPFEQSAAISDTDRLTPSETTLNDSLVHREARQPERSTEDEQSAAPVPLPSPDPDGVLSLSPGAVYMASTLPEREQLRITSSASHPAVILVRNEPLQLTGERITLENIWIVAARAKTDGQGSAAPPVTVSAKHLTVQHCGFRASPTIDENTPTTVLNPRAARPFLAWNANSHGSETGGILHVSESVFLDGGLVANLPLSAALFVDVLKTGEGPLLELAAGVSAGYLVPLVLRSTTLHACGPLVTIPASVLPDSGKLSLQGADSVFSLQPGSALLEFVGHLPVDWEESVEIAAAGLIIAADSTLSGFREQREFGMLPLETDRMKVDGLLAGEFHFVAQPEAAEFLWEPVIDSLPVRLSGRTPGAHLSRLPVVVSAP